ncbi:MAG: hypothetical protein CL882_01020 [Dehalococcoidia bacterium]|nr:hypothetical protein [Dehalococcoidia bacterium]MBS20161.1 hypothetical protein [Chloroflexota bacterium]|tara:strand:+ start:3574 stop:3822 length:249 start_codon:yes stop_codon:yes gene_type:complete
MYLMTVLRFPFVWGLFGFIIGAFLGANNTSVILLTLLLVGFLVFMKLSGPAEEKKEGLLFAGGPILIIAWILGFMIKGLVLN